MVIIRIVHIFIILITCHKSPSTIRSTFVWFLSNHISNFKPFFSYFVRYNR